MPNKTDYYIPAKYFVERDHDRCIRCQACVRQCPYEATFYDADSDKITNIHKNCVNCKRCEFICPTDCITVIEHRSKFAPNYNWPDQLIENVYEQATFGGIKLTGMGCDQKYPLYFNNILLNASQVTNPSIDPLREPMELRTFIGRKPEKLEFDTDGKLITKGYPQIELAVPIMFGAMSLGSISYNAFKTLVFAANKLGTASNTGEGGLPNEFYPYGKTIIVQCASGRFGVSPEYLNSGCAVEIKIGQGAKPGIGGHLPAEKVDALISTTRMIPQGTDAISPAPHHDIYSIEDLKQLIDALKEATENKKPVGVKIAAVHNVAAIASGIVRAGADFVTIDGFRGGTGAAPWQTRNNVGIPIELAIASVDTRLRQEGIRHCASIIAAGSIRQSSDVMKIIALGADAVYIATSALMTMGCTLCQTCYTGRCAWGITTQDPYLTKRLNPERCADRLMNLVNAWSHEMKEILGGMGLNSIESLRGNRLHLRGVGLSDTDLDVLGILPAGKQ
jgi:glutamate synthase domain-containing protein 2